MGLAKTLSEKATRSLGNFEVNYIVDPEALTVVNE